MIIFFSKSMIRFFVVCYSLIAAKAMYTKRGMGDDYHTSQSDKRLRHNLASLFCENSVSGARAASLFSDAKLAGAKHVGDLQVKASSNSHRDVLAKLLKKKTQSLAKTVLCKHQMLEP